MKKLPFSLLVCLLSTRLLLAQDTGSVLPPASGVEQSSGDLKFGFRVGPTFSLFAGDQPHLGESYGFTVGGVVSYAFSSSFSVQSEPAYLQQGGRFQRFTDNTRFGDTSPFGVYSTSSSVTIHNIDIPLLAKYQLPIGFPVNVVLGPSFGFMVGANESYERTYRVGNYFSTYQGYQKVTDQYEPFQIGGTTGFGTEMAAGSNRIMIDIRYRYAFMPTKKGFSYIDYAPVQGDLYSHSFYFTIGFGF